MRITLESLLTGARKAQGTVIIIDVYRAFTTAAVAFSRGATKIIMVAEIGEALELRRRGLGQFCMGEVEGIKPEEFAFGNSPYELSQAQVKGKTIIQSTRAGTSGVSAAKGAEAIYAASFVNAGATVRNVLHRSPPLVTIVAMGWNGTERSDEDELCALYIRNLLEGRQPDKECVRKLALVGGHSQKFGDPALPHFHPKDRDIALQIDAFDFAIRVKRERKLLVARPETPGAK